jgi:hypothetical protein
MRRGAVCVLLVALATDTVATELAPLGGCGPVARRYDAVEVTGTQLRAPKGTAVSRLGVIAFRDGKPSPIPFQLDERAGRKVALGNGPEPSQDDKAGTLDFDDVLVFMACDAGEAADAAAVAAVLPATDARVVTREIRIEDPLTHAVAFAYLVIADAPPASDRHYVAYEPNGDLVSAAAYKIGLVRALPTYFALSLHQTLGPNLLDGLRLRAQATLRADLATWRLNEQQGAHSLIAWKSGPVRVLRRSRHQVTLPLGIRLTAGLAHTYFYARHVFGPGSMKLPFSPSVFFRDITAFGGVDGRDLRGWRYWAPGVPSRGFRIDGRMDEEERAYTAAGEWFVLANRRSNADEALLVVTRMSPNLAEHIQLGLVYRDDAEHPDPPESSPGTVPLAGYQGTGVEHVPGGRYTFALRILVLDRYRPGDERQLLAQIDNPPLVTVSGPGVPAGGRAAAR